MIRRRAHEREHHEAGPGLRHLLAKGQLPQGEGRQLLHGLGHKAAPGAAPAGRLGAGRHAMGGAVSMKKSDKIMTWISVAILLAMIGYGLLREAMAKGG